MFDFSYYYVWLLRTVCFKFVCDTDADDGWISLYSSLFTNTGSRKQKNVHITHITRNLTKHRLYTKVTKNSTIGIIFEVFVITISLFSVPISVWSTWMYLRANRCHGSRFGNRQVCFLPRAITVRASGGSMKPQMSTNASLDERRLFAAAGLCSRWSWWWRWNEMERCPLGAAAGD